MAQKGQHQQRQPAPRVPRRLPAAIAVMVAAAWLLESAPFAAGESSRSERLEFRGQVVIPPQARMRRRRIVLTLQDVATGYSKRETADSRGRFRFQRITPGTYSLSILIPGAGELRRTVAVTRSFADSRGRVEREFVFDEDQLAREALPVQQGVISLRQLSIPYRAQREYAAARRDLRRQEPERARRRLRKAIEEAPQFAEALNLLGVLSYQSGDFSAATDYFRRALEQDPEAYEPLVNLGGALLALGQAEQAVEFNRKAHQRQPRDALASAQLGLSYYLLGDDEEARNYLLLTEQLDPAHYTNPQLALANIYLRNSQPELAIEELEDFLAHHPDSAQAESVRATLRDIRMGHDPAATARQRMD